MTSRGSEVKCAKLICPHDGHIIDHPAGEFCADHGVKWFRQCRACDALWPTRPYGQYARSSLMPRPPRSQSDRGSDFCENCGMPGPWLTRPQLMEWLRSNVKGSREGSATERLELIEALTKLEGADADDTRTVEVWKKIRDTAPKLWDKAKPVLDVVIADTVKKYLGF